MYVMADVDLLASQVGVEVKVFPTTLERQLEVLRQYGDPDLVPRGDSINVHIDKNNFLFTSAENTTQENIDMVMEYLIDYKLRRNV